MNIIHSSVGHEPFGV